MEDATTQDPETPNNGTSKSSMTGRRRVRGFGLAKAMLLENMAVHRRNHLRAEAHGDALLKKHYGDAYDPPKAGDDDVSQQYIDSDVQEHHYHYPKDQNGANRQGMSTAGKALTAAALIGLGAGGAALLPVAGNWIAGRVPVSESVDTDTATQLELETADGVLPD